MVSLLAALLRPNRQPDLVPLDVDVPTVFLEVVVGRERVVMPFVFVRVDFAFYPRWCCWWEGIGARHGEGHMGCNSPFGIVSMTIQSI